VAGHTQGRKHALAHVGGLSQQPALRAAKPDVAGFRVLRIGKHLGPRGQGEGFQLDFAAALHIGLERPLVARFGRPVEDPALERVR
jgi:hypothetical protein